jgi:hypothetical protein
MTSKSINCTVNSRIRAQKQEFIVRIVATQDRVVVEVVAVTAAAAVAIEVAVAVAVAAAAEDQVGWYLLWRNILYHRVE